MCIFPYSSGFVAAWFSLSGGPGELVRAVTTARSSRAQLVGHLISRLVAPVLQKSRFSIKAPFFETWIVATPRTNVDRDDRVTGFPMFAGSSPSIIGMSSSVPGAGDDESVIYDTLMYRAVIRVENWVASGLYKEIMEIAIIRRGIDGIETPCQPLLL